MTRLRKAGLATAAVAVVGAGVLGGTAIANASDDSGTASARHDGYGGPGGPGGPGGSDELGGPEGSGGEWAHGGPFTGTAVTGAELTSVTAAVTGHDATLTVDHVVKEDDGTFLAFATTEDDARTLLTVSADFKTVTEAEGPGGPGGHGPVGGPMGGGSEVTGDALTKLTAAVTAYDAKLTVEKAFQRSDGGDYVVLATKGTDHVGLTVSSDLGTVTELTRPEGGPMGGHGFRGGPEAPTPPTPPSTPPSTQPEAQLS